MDSITNGLTQGDFTLLRVFDPATGQMTDILALIGAAGGTVTSAAAPLAINSGVLSINLAGYIPTSHESYNVGQANVDFGAYDARTQTLTLQNASGVTCQLNVDLGGNLNVGTARVVTVPILSAWAPTALKLTDSAGAVRSLTSATTGELLWNGLELQLRQNAFHSIAVAAPLTISGANSITIDTLWKPSTVTGTHITTTANDQTGTLALAVDTSTIATVNSVNTSLATKQDSLSASTGIFMNGSTISSYGLRWNTNSTPTITIEDLHFKTGLTVSESLNLSSGKMSW